jgi:hypothetical protein
VLFSFSGYPDGSSKQNAHQLFATGNGERSETMNHYLSDKNLSMKAKGLLSVMLAMPESRHYSLSELAGMCKDGVTAIRGTVRELEDGGYLSRRCVRDGRGCLTATEYTICETPYRIV